MANKKLSDSTLAIIIVAAIVVVVIVASIVIGVVVGQSCSGKALRPEDVVTEKPGAEIVYDPEAGEYVAVYMPKASPQNVQIKGFGELTIPPNTTEINIDLENPIGNKDYYNLSFEIWLKNPSGEDELLYASAGVVPPGMHIQKITLSRAFEPGTYDCYLHVQPYRIEDNTTTNDANLDFKLIVK